MDSVKGDGSRIGTPEEGGTRSCIHRNLMPSKAEVRALILRAGDSREAGEALAILDRVREGDSRLDALLARPLSAIGFWLRQEGGCFGLPPDSRLPNYR